MNDRFKFRVWFDGRFIYKSLCDSNVYTEDNKCICLANTLPANLHWEQCTGLKDKNGRLIYEGDIVRQISKCEPEYEEYITEVKWCEFGYPLYDEESFDFEVIGNIHTNPELMEKEVDDSFEKM